MPKRANGEGTIKHRADGSWEARYMHDGKRRSVYGKTQAEVIRKLKEAKSIAEAGVDLSVSHMTVEEWMRIWMQEYRGRVKESTKVTYANEIRLHILPYIGKTKLQQLKTVSIQRMYNVLV